MANAQLAIQLELIENMNKQAFASVKSSFRAQEHPVFDQPRARNE